MCVTVKKVIKESRFNTVLRQVRRGGHFPSIAMKSEFEFSIFRVR